MVIVRWLDKILRLIYHGIVPAVLVVLAVTALWFLAQELERPIYDRFIRWSAKPVAESSPVKLVLIDDASFQRLSDRYGPPPWPRKSYLEVFEKLQEFEPTVMVLDSHFTPMKGMDDAVIFQQMRRFNNLVTGVALNPNETLYTEMPDYFRLNLGVVNTEPDMVDGVVRRIIPYRQYEAGIYSSIFPALSLQATFDYLNFSKHQPVLPHMESADGDEEAARPGSPGESRHTSWQIRSEVQPQVGIKHLTLFPETDPNAGFQIPLDDAGRFLVRWYSLVPQLPAEGQYYRRSHEAIPLWRFFDDETLPKHVLKGKIALLGSSSAMFRDYHPTPMSPHHLGADIHATAIDNFLRGEVLTPVAEWQQWLLLLLLTCGAAALRIFIKRFSVTMLYVGTFMVVYLWGSFVLIREFRIVLDVVTPEMFMIVGLLVGSTWRVIRRDKEVENLETAISQLVSSTVFDEIQRLGNVLAPGGQRLHITSMFVDIRDFTAIAERFPPNDVTTLLNEFYTEVESVVFRNHGTIDKFMGDGILIMFGAPLQTETHSDEALKAALELLEVAQTLHEKWKPHGLDFEMGISVNSGVAYVGFVGPSYKLEYTGVGDTVNCCVRLQDQNKRFKVRLVLSDSTRNDLKDENQKNGLVFLDDVLVRGRQSTVGVYTTQDCIDRSPVAQEAAMSASHGITTAAVSAQIKALSSSPTQGDEGSADGDSVSEGETP